VDVAGLVNRLDMLSQAMPVITLLKAQVEEAGSKLKLFNGREALFGREATNYERLGDLKKTMEPYQSLWETASAWAGWQKAWLHGSFHDLDAEQMEKDVNNASRAMFRSVKTFERLGIDVCLDIARKIKDEVDAFKPNLPLITALRNPGMRERHWAELSDAIGLKVDPERDRASFTLTAALGMNLQAHLDGIGKVAEKAAKEFQIETALDKMAREWEGVALEIAPYRETGTHVLKGVDTLQALLDEHTTMTQAMAFSAFKKPFAERIEVLRVVRVQPFRPSALCGLHRVRRVKEHPGHPEPRQGRVRIADPRPVAVARPHVPQPI
jgi:dynein heavy chain